MTVVQMQKVAVIAHTPLQEAVINRLHQEGALQVIAAEALSETKEHIDVQFRAAELQFAIDTLTNVASKETIAVSDKPSSEEDIQHAATHTDVRGVVDSLRALEESDTSAEKEIQNALSIQEALKNWREYPYNVEQNLSSEYVTVVKGTLPLQAINLVESELTQKNAKVTLKVVQESDTGEASCIAYVWKQDMRTFEEIATTHGWTNYSLPALEGNAKSLYEEAKLQEMELRKKKQDNHDTRVQLSIDLPKLLQVRTFMSWLHDKQGVRNALSETADTVTIFGWMPKSNVDLFEDRLQKEFPATAVLKIKPDEGEMPPVLLKNAPWVKPFESVTGLYGLPKSNEIDPTMALAPFFIVYFGLCLTDAGYGAVLALLFGGYILKTKKTIDESKLVWLLFMSGIVTFFVSIPFGGWFGLTPDQMPDFLTYTSSSGSRLFLGQIWNLSEQSGISFLQNLAMIIGLTHLFFGMFLAGWYKWVHGQKAAAFWQDFTSHMLLGAVLFSLLAPENLADIAKWTLYTVLALTIWGKGYGNVWYLRPIFGFLNFVNLCIGLLSNGLSYLRILALGLVTGAIALAVNKVAVELGHLFPPFLGVPVTILIFLMGHLVSIALNTLGSFIHSGRLQFIEFFSQFFEGGGQGYSPFRRKTI